MYLKYDIACALYYIKMKSSNVRLLVLISLGVLATAQECSRACTRLCVASTDHDE